MTHPASRRVAAVEDDLRERGDTLEPDDLATVTRGDHGGLLERDAPIAVEPIADGRPLSVVSAVANAAHEGRVPVLVGDEEALSAAESLLSAPFALAGHAEGRRQFHTVEDRIMLTDGTFACAADDGDLQWAEDETRAEAEDPRLQLSVGGDVVAVFDSVEGLTCPGPEPEAFPLRYGRGEDGRFRVFDREGVVGQYTSIGAMRRDGYRPVPLPLVPEHHVRHSPELARAVRLAVVEDGTVTYERPAGP
jgi:hypothetical protein